MARWRDQKRKALGDIHRTFEIPAVYLTHAAGTPISVDVRLHRKPVVANIEVDDWSNVAARVETADRIVFRTSQLGQVLGKAYVIFGNAEAYMTGPSKPEREGFVHVEVSDVSQADLDALLGSIDTTGPIWARVLS